MKFYPSSRAAIFSPLLLHLQHHAHPSQAANHTHRSIAPNAGQHGCMVYLVFRGARKFYVLAVRLPRNRCQANATTSQHSLLMRPSSTDTATACQGLHAPCWLRDALWMRVRCPATASAPAFNRIPKADAFRALILYAGVTKACQRQGFRMHRHFWILFQISL